MSTEIPDHTHRATIRDVAARAGVGIKTVSRVVNAEPNVSADTRQKVQDAIRELNYRPNLGAGALRRSDGKSYTIGLLLDAIDNPFSAAINRAVEKVAAAHRTAVFAASFEDDPERERAVVDAFARRRVDGLILTTISSDHSYLQTELDQGTAMVFVDRPPIRLRADSVLADNFEASRLATRHLIEHGHSRIAHLGDELTISTARHRRAGFSVALREAGLADRKWQHIDGLRSVDEASAAVQRLMHSSQPPTALYTSQNLVTLGALRALHALDLQNNIAMIGFDDVPMADVVQPGVTVMAQDPAAIGTLAAERLFQRIDGLGGDPTTQIVPCTLIVRGSGEIPPQE